MVGFAREAPFGKSAGSQVLQSASGFFPAAKSPASRPWQAKGIVSTVVSGICVYAGGAGPGFCAGQDLSEQSVIAEGDAIDLGAPIEKYYAPLVLQLHSLKVPVLCAVNGVAAGAGANLALACDIVIAKKSASFIQSFCKLGLIPDTGGTYALPRLIGTARAMGLALLGDKLPAEQAAAWGMIWQCVDDADFDSVVDKIAQQLAGAPTQALARTKEAILSSGLRTLEQQLNYERVAMRDLGQTVDYKEGVAAFLEKRMPVFRGR